MLGLVAEAITPRTSTIAITPVHELNAKVVPGRKQGATDPPAQNHAELTGRPSLPG